MENYEPNIHKQVKLNPNNLEPSESDHGSESSESDHGSESSESDHGSESSESDHGSESSESDHGSESSENVNQQIPNLPNTKNFHNRLRDGDEDSAIYLYIKALHKFDPKIPLVVSPKLIDLNEYPGLSETILDSVRNEGGNLIIDENNLTVNSTNLILQGILDGLNAENPQFQGLTSLQILSNVADVDNVGMDQESMNLLSAILLHQNNTIKHLDIRNNNIDPNHLNILLGSIAENPNLTRNLRELDFSVNLINQDSVPLLTGILANNLIVKINAEYILPEDVLLEGLEALADNPRFNPDESIATETTNLPNSPSNSNIINPSHENSLNSSFDLSWHS
jgi:hypothetical protein